MDTAVKERLIGAAVLVAVVVLVVPALLTGPRPPAGPVEPSAVDTRVVEIDLARDDDVREAGELAVADTPANPPEQQAAPKAATLPAPEKPAAAPSQAAPAPAVATVERPAAPAAATSGGWAVQVAALSKADAAERMAAGLRKKGYAAFVQEHRSDGRVLYRVRVGPEVQRERAEALARRLTDEGFKPSVVTQP
jgi:DedD protein